MAAWKARDHHLDLTVDWKQDKNNKKGHAYSIYLLTITRGHSSFDSSPLYLFTPFVQYLLAASHFFYVGAFTVPVLRQFSFMNISYLL